MGVVPKLKCDIARVVRSKSNYICPQNPSNNCYVSDLQLTALSDRQILSVLYGARERSHGVAFLWSPTISLIKKHQSQCIVQLLKLFQPMASLRWGGLAVWLVCISHCWKLINARASNSPRMEVLFVAPTASKMYFFPIHLPQIISFKNMVIRFTLFSVNSLIGARCGW